MRPYRTKMLPTARMQRLLENDRTEQPGIYSIVNEARHRAYVGSTSHPIQARWKGHNQRLAGSRHHVPALQADWDADGITAFTFLVAEVYTGLKIDRLRLEAEWMRIFQDAGYVLYNQQPPRRDAPLTSERALKECPHCHRGFMARSVQIYDSPQCASRAAWARHAAKGQRP